MMRYWGLILAISLMGCAHQATEVHSDTVVDLGRYHKIGVLPFADFRGQGNHISDGIENGLRQLHFSIADSKALEKLLTKNRPDPFYGISLETLTAIRTQTSADAIITGVMARDWHQATMNLIETEQGDTVLRATLRPRNKKKVFGSADEVIAEAMLIFAEPGGDSQ